MRVKKAIEICKSIKSSQISLYDKMTAIQTILECQTGPLALSKAYLFEVIEFLKTECEKAK